MMKNKQYIYIYICSIFFNLVSCQVPNIGVNAEWDNAKMILMHTPGEEVFWGNIHPEAALFEKSFNSKKAKIEHLNYIKVLQDNGIRVFNIVDVLLNNIIDENEQIKNDLEFLELKKFAEDFLVINSEKNLKSDFAKQNNYKKEIINSLDPIDLVRIILLNPVINLKKTKTNTYFKASYETCPLMNLYFCRDQIITTSKGVVIGKMNSQQRFRETKLLEFVLKKLNIKPVYKVKGDGRLEGGDFISAGKVSFICQSLRTNRQAIKQLLDNKVFGNDKVVVVKDSWKNQEQMHLDTFFNIIRPGLAVLVDLRMKKSDVLPKVKTVVDVYSLTNNGEYKKEISDMDFQTYLENHLGYKIIPVSRADQNLYATNFLTIAENKICAVDGCSQAYKDDLKKYNVDVIWLDFENLTKGYGAAHCMTQVLSRESK